LTPLPIPTLAGEAGEPIDATRDLTKVLLRAQIFHKERFRGKRCPRRPSKEGKNCKFFHFFYSFFHLFYRNIEFFYRNIEFFYRNNGFFYRNIEFFYRNIDFFYRNIEFFYRNIGFFYRKNGFLYSFCGIYSLSAIFLKVGSEMKIEDVRKATYSDILFFSFLLENESDP